MNESITTEQLADMATAPGEWNYEVKQHIASELRRLSGRVSELETKLENSRNQNSGE